MTERDAIIEAMARAIDPSAWAAHDTAIASSIAVFKNAAPGLVFKSLQSATAALDAALPMLEEMARNHTFLRPVGWWLDATKKDVSAEACLSFAAALRSLQEPSK